MQSAFGVKSVVLEKIRARLRSRGYVICDGYSSGARMPKSERLFVAHGGGDVLGRAMGVAADEKKST